MNRRTTTQTQAGTVEGVDQGTHVAFLGVPVAEPPVGPRRHRPPARVASWSGTRPAHAVGPICPQVHDDLDRLIGVPQMPASESDFLTANVWTPDVDAEQAHPVVVWVHGGSYTTGSNAWPIYHGPSFARDGVVFVGLNYRLHALGFLDLTEWFPGAEESANLAVQDVVLGLEWVRDNIAAFGGDPDRVTIFGESAGAGMVTALMTAPSARGLFHRAIPQSGFSTQYLEREQSSRVARNFLAAAGVAPGDWDALRSLPVERVVEVASDTARLLDGVPGSPWLAWNHVRDEATLPRTGYEEVLRGGTAHLDLLIGTTADENKLGWLVAAPDGSDYPVDRLPDADVERLVEVYRQAGRGTQRWELAEAIVNDQSYLIPSVRAAEAHRERGGRVFQYLFTWPTPVLDGRLGSCHALEIPFVFDLLDQPEFLGEDPPQELADAMHAAWIRFAATGDPGGGRLPEWPQYDAARRTVMCFGDQIAVASDPRGAERAAWDGLGPEVLGVL